MREMESGEKKLEKWERFRAVVIWTCFNKKPKVGNKSAPTDIQTWYKNNCNFSCAYTRVLCTCHKSFAHIFFFPQIYAIFLVRFLQKGRNIGKRARKLQSLRLNVPKALGRQYILIEFLSILPASVTPLFNCASYSEYTLSLFHTRGKCDVIRNALCCWLTFPLTQVTIHIPHKHIVVYGKYQTWTWNSSPLLLFLSFFTLVLFYMLAVMLVRQMFIVIIGPWRKCETSRIGFDCDKWFVSISESKIYTHDTNFWMEYNHASVCTLVSLQSW